jgi:hypothetical protein
VVRVTGKQGAYLAVTQEDIMIIVKMITNMGEVTWEGVTEPREK